MTQHLQPSVSDNSARPATRRPVLEARSLSVSYGGRDAVRNVSFDVAAGEILAFIGPSGCGKSTVIRSLNRLNDLVSSARVDGELLFHGKNLYDPDVDAGEVRRKIGMVFQKPNPFPKSIYDNVAFGPRKNRTVTRADLDDVVEVSLRRAALWDEVKTRLRDSAYSLSGGQQQRLCIARALAVGPEVLLMDEPCSALDPIATGRIEDLMGGLKQELPIIVVTHNMQQASRVSDLTAFFSVETEKDSGRPCGLIVEFDATLRIFGSPSDPRTAAYVSGRVG